MVAKTLYSTSPRPFCRKSFSFASVPAATNQRRGMPPMLSLSTTILALATPPGEGAIGIIRLSGPDAITITQQIFAGKNLTQQPGHTLHFGKIMDGDTIVDEVVASLYRAPRSYTGEDVVELSCHGSAYILQQVMALCRRHGAVMAKPGEFTLRAFLNGKMDLAQAEAVADLIASHSEMAHKAAMHNLRGGFSHDLMEMRERLIQFSALIELELDFSEEDVEFADRTRFYQLIAELTHATQQLVDSFRLGNVIKNGVSVAIVGKPNAGKSTLLNTLLNEERAIVSDIAGTTRDTIEETLNINGILFRLIDTAGIRDHSSDLIELQGIERSRDAMKKADIVVYLFELTPQRNQTNQPTGATLQLPAATNFEELRTIKAELTTKGTRHLLVGNKADEMTDTATLTELHEFDPNMLFISARNKDNIHQLKEALYNLVAEGGLQNEGTIITNARHFASLTDVLRTLQDIKAGLDNHLPGDLLSLDIRACLYALGEITGVVTNEDKLDYIFSKFCIGK